MSTMKHLFWKSVETGHMHEFDIEDDEVNLHVGGLCPFCGDRRVTAICFDEGRFRCGTTAIRDAVTYEHDIPPKVFQLRDPGGILKIIRIDANGKERTP